MKPLQVILPIVAVLVAAALAAGGWLLWRRFSRDNDVLLQEAGLDVSLLQGAMTLRFINRADEQELEAAGIRPRQRQLILEHRPLSSLAELSDITGIGRGTLRAAAQAAMH